MCKAEEWGADGVSTDGQCISSFGGFPPREAAGTPASAASAWHASLPKQAARSFQFSGGAAYEVGTITSIATSDLIMSHIVQGGS